jgi:hypothetical protein
MSDAAPKIAMPRQMRAVVPAASGEGLGMALHFTLQAGARLVSQPPAPMERSWPVMGLNVPRFCTFRGP